MIRSTIKNFIIECLRLLRSPNGWAAIAAGASMRLISPPIGWYALHWFNIIVVFWALSSRKHMHNAAVMYLFGVSLYITNYYWITESAQTFANIPLVLCFFIILLYALFFALPFSLLGFASHWLRDRVGWSWIFLLPGLQVAIEQTWPSLFPYYHGALLYRSEWTWQFASVLGVTSLTYLIFLVNATGAEFIYRRREAQKYPVKIAVAVLVLMMGVTTFGYFRHGQLKEEIAKAPRIRVSVLQQDVTMKHRMDRDPWESIYDWRMLSDRILDQKPDLVIWPEGAIGGPYNPTETRPCTDYKLTSTLIGPASVRKACNVLKNQSLHTYFSAIAKDNDTYFLMGGGTFEPFIVDAFIKAQKENKPIDYYATNSIYLFDRSGTVTGRYDKMIPLPFGEYIPLSDTFPILRKMIQGVGNFHAGKEVTYFKATFKGKEYTFSTPICYEAILNSQMRKMSDADVFINVTNDAWFGDSAAPHQHAMLATVQSIEWGSPMIRNAYTGVSFFVAVNGDITHEIPAFEEHASIQEFPLYTTETIFRKGGWIFPWLWVTAWPILWFVIRKKTPIFPDKDGDAAPESSISA